MTYKEFKKHFQDRAIKEYNFKRIASRVYYINEDVLLVLDIVKSDYSNSLSRFNLGITLVELSKKKIEILDQITCDASDISVSLVDDNYVELDEINDFNKYDEIFNNFFENNFSKFLSSSSIKEMIESGQLHARDRVKEYFKTK